MSFLRVLVFPTLIATPLWLATLPVVFRGWSALGDLSWRLGDWLFGILFTMLGLLLVGLPTASLVARQRLPVAAKVLLLLGAGVLGGGFVVIIFFMGLAALAGSLEGVFPDILMAATWGFLPGAVVAVVWMVFNFDRLQPEKGNG